MSTYTKFAREIRQGFRRLDPVMLSWIEYDGPRGGKGWQDDETGEILYQDEKPGDDRKGGDFAQMAEDRVGKNIAIRPGDMQAHHDEMLAKHIDTERHDPKEARRRAAQHLDADLHNLYESRVKEKPNAGLRLDKMIEGAYATAGLNLDSEADSREGTQAFVDSYYEHDEVDERLDRLFLMLSLPSDQEESGFSFDPDLIDDDLADGIVDDLDHWSSDPSDLNNAAWEIADNWGEDSKPFEWFTKAIEAKAAQSSSRAAFDPGEDNANMSEYAIADFSMASPQWRRYLNAAASLAGIGAKTSDGSVIVDASGSHGWTELSGNVEGLDEYPLDDAEHDPIVWDSLQSERTVGEADVPASAKNMGTTSGGAEIEKGWNPNYVQSAKRLNRDWYLVRRSSDDQAAVDDGSLYKYVHRKDMPVQVRLPEQYWQGQTSEYEQYDEDDAEERNRVNKNKTAEGSKAKREIAEGRQGIKDARKRVNQVRDAYNNVTQMEQHAQAHAKEASDTKDTIDDLRGRSPMLNDDLEDLQSYLADIIDEGETTYGHNEFDFDLPDWEEQNPDQTQVREDHAVNLKDSLEHAHSDLDDWDDEAINAKNYMTDQYSILRDKWNEFDDYVEDRIEAFGEYKEDDEGEQKVLDGQIASLTPSLRKIQEVARKRRDQLQAKLAKLRPKEA